MHYNTIKVCPWTIGSIVVSNTTDFDITEDKEYTIIGYGVYPTNFIIVDDRGVKEEYSEDYFRMKNL